MATKYYAVLTNVGAAKLANATALGVQVEITQMAVGDGNSALPTPNPAQTALVHELRRAPLNTLSIDPNNANQIIAEQVIPEDVGGWWIREIGLFDKDGDMIAVANCAETYKPQLQEGSGRVQVVRMILIVSSTAAVTLKIDPSVVLATRQYVDDQIIQVKAFVDQQLAAHIAAADPHKQYAPKASPDLTGTPTAPTAAQSVNNTQIATTAFVKSAIAGMVGSAPAALDTLNELAAALGNDPNFATTMLNALAGKQPLDNTLTNLSGKDVAGLLTYLGLGDASGYVGRLLNVQVFYNSGIYTATTGTKKVIVEMVGGGAGSAGSRAAGSGQVAVGGAGGAGSYAKGSFTQNFNGVQVTVGAKGAGGTVSGPYASDGGTSSFGSLISAAGGAAGQPAGPTSSFPFSTVAAVVSAGANGANIIGTPGQGASASVVVNTSVVIESPGGSSQFGAGGFITAFNAKGVNGSGYGAGGGPSKVNSGGAAVAGGDGSQGLVIVWEYA
ncbi:phage tail protein [Escherichia coli]|nr:phage tail protein [Escherichia coli]